MSNEQFTTKVIKDGKIYKYMEKGGFSHWFQWFGDWFEVESPINDNEDYHIAYCLCCEFVNISDKKKLNEKCGLCNATIVLNSLMKWYKFLELTNQINDQKKQG